jgi:hypothetical protein
VTSGARRQFLEGVRAYAEAAQESSVIANTTAGAFLRRGMAVSLFSLFEGFLVSRMNELTAFANAGHLSYSELPSRLKKRAIGHILEIAPAHLKRLDGPESASYIAALGESLASVNGPFVFSELTWKWRGSNVSADDLSSILNSFHVDNVWTALRELSGRAAFDTTDFDAVPFDMKERFDSWSQERHKSAHDSTHHVSVLRLNSLHPEALRFAFAVDVFASLGVSAVRDSDADYLKDVKWLRADGPKIRRVNSSPGHAEETVDGLADVVASGDDARQLYAEAIGRAVAGEVVTLFDVSGQLEDWTISGVG